MISDLTLRLASEREALPIAQMSRDQIERGLGWSWTAQRVLRSIHAADTNVVVALAGGKLSGFGIMKYHDDEAHLLLLAVQPGARRQGVGSALMAWLEQSAVTAGLGQVWLEARHGNAAARAFYRELGYREILVMPGYYQGREACVRIARDLWLEHWEAD